MVVMNGLRVYVNPAVADARCGLVVFYSRRADGPYYRWCDEQGLGQWRCSRVPASHWTLKALCVASWRTMPAALQLRLGEHYLE